MTAPTNVLPRLESKLGNAKVFTEGDILTVDTGRISRSWKWLGTGFSTVEVTERTAGQSWKKDNNLCDWQMPDASEPGDAQLISLSATESDDQGFTSKHLCAVAEIEYADLLLKLQVWAYPDSPGLRTHIQTRRKDGAQVQDDKPATQGGRDLARIDALPVGVAECTRRMIGYFNDTQNRNDTNMDILKEHTIDHALTGREFCSWASALCVEDGNGGLALVKESHKCVNQAGHSTGGFTCDHTNGIVSTGWGAWNHEIRTDRWTNSWASWCIAWSGGDLERETAFKIFDAIRYPIDPGRDIYVQANTWGSTSTGLEARKAATEKPVLEELEACKDIGVDLLQIDDGWQVPPGNHTWDPGENGWHPHPESYPEGWDNVKAKAAELGIGLSLWAAAVPISEDELVQNFEEAGFRQFKLDFAVLKSRDEIDDLMMKVRQFTIKTGHKVRINWDVTERSPRYGYFFAREYGCIYLSNRKPERPHSVVYRPHTNLRDWWQISKYLNLHRFQCSIQNVDMVDKERSDAYLHPHDYVTAIALMGIPLFFQQTQLYSDAARTEVRKVLDAYRPHREAIYRGVVHPIGQRPDNASWTGFQCMVDRSSGYLSVFRERCNSSETGLIQIHSAAGRMLKLTDLVSDSETIVQADRKGAAEFTIPSAPGFILAQYELE